MFNCLRRIVGGQKNRTIQGDYDLDLTYITENLIAMAFPASGIQQTYRNPIQDVARYLNQKHRDDYHIFNQVVRRPRKRLRMVRPSGALPYNSLLNYIGGKQYTQGQKFSHLENRQSVIAVHCNHGKGRTGTAIMCILMFNKKCKDVEETLRFYNAKRFSTQNYKVEQPCQIRYLNFFKQLLDSPSQFKQIKSYRLSKIAHEGLNDRYYLKISQVRNKRVILDRLQINDQKQVNQFLIGDVFIEIIYRGLLHESRAARINYHLSFLEMQENKHLARFESSNISVGFCHNASYSISLQFEDYCKCHIVEDKNCSCHSLRTQELKYWTKMHKYIANGSNTMNQNQINLEVIQSDNLLKK